MNYKALIFDLDGTLADSFSAIHQSLAKAMEAVETIPWDLATTKTHVGWGIEALLESAVGPAKRDRALVVFREQYSRAYLTQTALFPSVRETLHELFVRGYRMAVATNKHSFFSRNILEYTGVSSYFFLVLGPNDVTRPKPDPEMLETLMKHMGVQQRETLYVGDMPLDVETASNAGVDCLLVATGPYSFEHLCAQCAVPVVARFSEIVDHLDTRSQMLGRSARQ